ncbi:MAG: DUF4340 domain-containing protein [Nitrospirae bacterium]|nr:DUF4340 domain-containing protein [Nitrospirota bacterium]
MIEVYKLTLILLVLMLNFVIHLISKNMKNGKKYILLGVIIIASGVYLTQEKGDRLDYNLPRISRINTEDLTMIMITKIDSTITLERNNDHWLILPDGYVADKKKVDEIIRAIVELNIVMLISDTNDYVVYGLDDRNKITVTAYGGGTVLREFEIGNTGPSRLHTFVKLTNDKRIYYAKNTFRSNFDLTTAELGTDH